MDQCEIDRWIAQLGTSDLAIEKLASLGEPALERLFDVLEGRVQISTSADPRDSFTARAVALGRLGARHPEVFLGLVQGRSSLKLGVIQALGFTGDERLKAVATEALKNFGNDW
jgi:hypothetical protein